MTGTDRQAKSPRPQGSGGASVPVLFSLRNVQPNIVVGGAKTASVANSETNQATKSALPDKTTSASPIAQAGTPITKSVASPPKSNRSYNIVVGLLVIAVCFLAIKNTQRTGQNSKTSSVAKTDGDSNFDLPMSTATMPMSTATKSPLVATTPSKTIEPTETTKTSVVLSPPTLDIPPLPPMLSVAPQTNNTNSTASTETESTLKNDSASLLELNAYQSRSAESTAPSSQTAAVPMLLSSSKPETSTVNIPSLPATGLAKNADTPSISFPDARTAMNPEMRSNPSQASPLTSPSNVQPIDLTPDSNLPIRSNETKPQSAFGTNPYAALPATTLPMDASPIVDSSSPTVTTKEYLEVAHRYDQSLNKPANNMGSPVGGTELNGQYVPASPVSNVSPMPTSSAYIPYSNAATSNTTYGNAVPNNSNPKNYAPDNGMLAGQPYPPLPKENQPLPIRAYEQGGMFNPAAPANGSANSVGQPGAQPIRQPSGGTSNRYAPLTSPSSSAPMPYKPINATGYPPGNGN